MLLMKRITTTPTPEETALWNQLVSLQGTTFQTSKGMEFTYTIRGGEMFVERKEKSITMSTIFLSFHRVQELQQEGKLITGPKKIGTFGASYLYPIFIKLGIIQLDGQNADAGAADC